MKLRKILFESFLPLFVVLVVLLTVAVYVDSLALEMAQGALTIRLSPGDQNWNADLISDRGVEENQAEAEIDPAAVSEQLKNARALAESGDLAAAVSRLDAALEESPGDAALLNETAVYLLRTEQVESAISRLDQAISARSDHFRLYYNRGVAHSRLNRFENARADYLAAIRLKPSHFESRYNLGLLLLSNDRPKAALVELEVALTLVGGMGRAHVYCSLGRAQARLGQDTLAHKAYQQAMYTRPDDLQPRFNQALLYAEDSTPEALAKAERLLDQIVALKPDFAPAYLVRGRLASKSGDDVSALRFYETAARYDSRFWKASYNQGIVALRLDRLDLARRIFARLEKDFPDRAEVWFNLGRIAYKDDDYRQAQEHYRHALRVRQDDYPEARLNLGLALRALGEYPAAIQTFDELIAKNAMLAEAWLNKGVVQIRLEAYEQARISFKNALEQDPKYAAAYYNLGKLESALDRHGESVEAYSRALEFEPDHLRAAMNLGVEKAALGDHPAAIEAYLRAIDIAPNYASAHFNLGLILRRQERLEEAIQAYQRVLELEPTHMAARQNLEVIYSSLGQTELAIRMYQEILEEDPAKVKIRYNLALQYKGLGQIDIAKQELRRVLRLDPGYIRAVASSVSLEAEDPAKVIDLLKPLADKRRATANQLRQLGLAYLARQQLKEAHTWLTASLDARPNRIKTLRALADVAEKQGDLHRALDLVRKMRALRPSSKKIAKQLERLSKKASK